MNAYVSGGKRIKSMRRLKTKIDIIPERSSLQRKKRNKSMRVLKGKIEIDSSCDPYALGEETGKGT